MGLPAQRGRHHGIGLELVAARRYAEALADRLPGEERPSVGFRVVFGGIGTGASQLDLGRPRRKRCTDGLRPWNSRRRQGDLPRKLQPVLHHRWHGANTGRPTRQQVRNRTSTGFGADHVEVLLQRLRPSGRQHPSAIAVRSGGQGVYSFIATNDLDSTTVGGSGLDDPTWADIFGLPDQDTYFGVASNVVDSEGVNRLADHQRIEVGGWLRYRRRNSILRMTPIADAHISPDPTRPDREPRCTVLFESAAATLEAVQFIGESDDVNGPGDGDAWFTIGW